MAWGGRGTLGEVTPAAEKKFLALPAHTHRILQRASAQLQREQAIAAGNFERRRTDSPATAVANYELARYQLDLPRAPTPLPPDYIATLAAHIPRWEISRAQLKRTERFRQKLVKLATSAIHESMERQGFSTSDVKIDLQCFGSFKSGFALPTSRVDLRFIAINTPYRLRCEFPFLLKQSFCNQGIHAVCLPGKGSKLQVCEKGIGPQSDQPPVQTSTTSHDPGVQCVIHFSNSELSLYSTDLLRCYRLCDDRVYEMGIFVKKWASERRINNPVRGTLSSYGYILMLLHYLINIANPPVLPNLHHCNLGSRELEWTEDCEIFYWRNADEITKAADEGKLTRNRQSTASLLQGFFEYYSARKLQPGVKTFCYATDVISIRNYSGLSTKIEKGWDSQINHSQRNYLSVEDPFRTSLNVACCVNHRGILAIKTEFARAHTIISRMTRTRNGWLWKNDEGRIGDHLLAAPVSFFSLPAPRDDMVVRNYTDGRDPVLPPEFDTTSTNPTANKKALSQTPRTLPHDANPTNTISHPTTPAGPSHSRSPRIAGTERRIANMNKFPAR
ncbi:hypothetical protein FQN50_002956 [Emmonsiellopsis sp. PD_5]|nr:hypothetical protein FQN50_002956 [Emmonsiellopsis sp. PD_5]